MYAFPEQISNISTPCVVSCTPLQPALQLDLTTPDPKTYNEFCTNSAFADNSVSTCEYCYALSSEQAYLANCKSSKLRSRSGPSGRCGLVLILLHLCVVLEAVRYNCHFQTPLGDAFAIAPSRIFNSTELPTTTTAITPSATSTSAPHVIHNLIIIILFPIIGFLILLALLSLCCFCIIRRQRRKLRERNLTQNLHTRWNDTTMSTPPIGSWSHPLTTYSPQTGMATPGFSPGFGHTYEFQNLYGRSGDIKSGFSNPSSPVEPWNPFPVQAHYYQPEKTTEPQEPLYFPPPPPKASR